MSDQREEQIFTVSEINKLVKDILDNIPPIWVIGEISNCKLHISGHIYFSLKDEKSQISCIMFKSYAKNLKLKLENGVKIKVFGDIGVYEKGGVYQIYVKEIREEGKGELQIAFEKLKNKLFEEGLFDNEHKIKIPEYPLNIGIITAKQAAAFKDVVNVLTRRAPFVKIILNPAQVQGDRAKQEIKAAIEEFNEYNNVDVILLVRGGGSIEDLWAFNEEIVARSIYDSHIPIITGIGHEVDFTIADFVSDLRVPTPSSAAEIAIKSKFDIESIINNLRQRILKDIIRNLNRREDLIVNYKKSYGLNRFVDIIRQKRVDIDRIHLLLTGTLLQEINDKLKSLTFLKKRVENTNYRNILKRGYIISRKDGEIVKSKNDINLYDRLILEYYDGKIRGIVDKFIKEK